VGGLCPACLRTQANGSTPPTDRLVKLPRIFHPATVSDGPLDLADAAVGLQDRPRPAVLPPPPPGYQMLNRLGSGGMGAVYLAWEQATERTVAMKFLHAPAGPSALDRFLVEVRALGRLDHPNIVRVLSVDTYRADPYFTMEYAAGGSLAERVSRDGPLEPDEAAGLIATVARAVHAAHEADVLHRDLKPSNILLSGDESRVTSDERKPASEPVTRHPPLVTPKVSDFGLAKRTDRDDDLTQGSGALGTPHFMPPEQTGRGRGTVGRHSDVYSLGATLYHLLTGRPPFTGESHEVIGKVLAEPPTRPRSLRPEVPADLEGIVVKCLEKDPADRYPTAAELADDLDRFLARQRTVAAPLTRRRRLARWAGHHRGWLGAVAVGLVVGVGLFLAGRYAPVPIRAAEDPPKPRPAFDPVVLLGETGRPTWAYWPLGPSEFFDAAEADGACAFAANSDTLLELVRDPPSDRYAVTADLRVVHRAATAKSITFAGLYCGYARAAGPDGSHVHTFLALNYNDHLSFALLKGNTQVNAQIRAAAAVGPPGSPRVVSDAPFSNTRFSFQPASVEPNPQSGDWRRVRLEVTPAGVEAFFATVPGNRPHPFRPLTASEINDSFHNPKTFSGKLCLEIGVAPPDWQPRMPVGVWCRTGAVAVRNVVIEPLP
jgi:hypothetical protein